MGGEGTASAAEGGEGAFDTTFVSTFAFCFGAAFTFGLDSIFGLGGLVGGCGFGGIATALGCVVGGRV